MFSSYEQIFRMASPSSSPRTFAVSSFMGHSSIYESAMHQAMRILDDFHRVAPPSKTYKILHSIDEKVSREFTSYGNSVDVQVVYSTYTYKLPDGSQSIYTINQQKKDETIKEHHLIHYYLQHLLARRHHYIYPTSAPFSHLIDSSPLSHQEMSDAVGNLKYLIFIYFEKTETYKALKEAKTELFSPLAPKTFL